MKSMSRSITLFLCLAVISLTSCVSKGDETVAVTPVEIKLGKLETMEVEFTLKTAASEGKLVYIGVGGEIDGIINPDLVVQGGQIVRLILVNGDGMPHDLFLPDWDVKTDYVSKIGDEAAIVFKVGNTGSGVFVYYCTVPGHRQAGQEGKVIVSEP